MKKKILMIVLICAGIATFGQINPMGSMYFQNRYVINPAMAGVETGWTLNAGYKVQWTDIDGAPSMESITADYGTENKKVGVGLNFYNEGAGVIRRTSAKASYAYHLSLNGQESSFLDFGLSAGIMDEWIDFDKVKGDLSDMTLYNFNQRQLYFDGDFGVAFRNERIMIQGSLPNLKRIFNRDLIRNVADRALFFAAASYKFPFKDFESGSIEPMLSFRSIQNYKDIIDAGANLQFNKNKLAFNVIYHSTNSVTFGIGTMYKGQLSILAQYTTNTSDLQNYSNGEFEIGLRYKFKNNNYKTQPGSYGLAF